MFEIAPFLNEFYAAILDRNARFLHARKAEDDDYAVVFRADPGDRLIIILYDERRFEDGDYHARVHLHGADGIAVVNTGLRMALGVLAATFDKPENALALRNLDLASTNDRDLAIADDAEPGIQLCLQNNLPHLINVEDRGERWTLATSPSQGALKYVAATIRYRELEKVGQRMATFEENGRT